MQVVVLRMMAAVAKHAPPHKHSTTKLGINSNYSFWARFLLCCIGEGVSGEAIEQKIKLGRSNIYGWLKESTTEFGNMLEKRLDHWGFIFLLSSSLFSSSSPYPLTNFISCQYCFTWLFPNGKAISAYHGVIPWLFLYLSFTFLESHAGIRGEE
jgi:hypothetical protein